MASAQNAKTKSSHDIASRRAIRYPRSIAKRLTTKDASKMSSNHRISSAAVELGLKPREIPHGTSTRSDGTGPDSEAVCPVDPPQLLLYCRKFAAHYGRSPEELGETEIREYLLHLIQVEQVSYATYRQIRGGGEVSVHGHARPAGADGTHSSVTRNDDRLVAHWNRVRPISCSLRFGVPFCLIH